MKVCYKKHGTDIYAVFPGALQNYHCILCYSHIGQHGECTREYIDESRNATPNEYAELHAEISEIYAPEQIEVSKRMTY